MGIPYNKMTAEMILRKSAEYNVQIRFLPGRIQIVGGPSLEYKDINHVRVTLNKLLCDCLDNYLVDED